MSNKTKWVIVIAVVIGILTGTVTGSVLRGEPVNWKAVSFNMVLAFGGFYLLLFLRKDIKQEEKDAHTKRKKIKKNNIKPELFMKHNFKTRIIKIWAKLQISLS